MSDQPRIVAISGEDSGQEWSFGVGVVDLGRGDDCAIRLADTAASRRHAQLQWDGGSLTLRDFGSTNKTYVNGHAVAEIDLRAGDVIQIGQTRLRVALPETPAAVKDEEPLASVTATRPAGRGVRLVVLVVVLAVVLGAAGILLLRPRAPVSGRELAARDRAAADASPMSPSAARDARALSPAARRAFEEGRTMALYGRLGPAREALQQSLRIESQNPTAAALLAEVEQQIDERIDVLVRRARAAIDDRSWIRARGALLEAADLIESGDPRSEEINQLRNEVDAREGR